MHLSNRPIHHLSPLRRRRCWLQEGKKGAAAAQQPAIVLDEGNRATYNTLKAQERQQTADTRQVRRWKYI